jgi:TetR/AcrR family transcriptional regulator
MEDPGSRRGRTPGKIPGRAHNAEAARNAILEAAEAVFAEHGFDGARIDLIAERSGYNKSLIFQYFDDKLNLYAAVIRHADEGTRQFQDRMLPELLQENTLNDAHKLKQLFKTFIGEYFDYGSEHPNFMRILNWEMAEGWQTYAKVLTERDFQDMDDFAPILQRIKEGGLLRSNFNPMAQIVMALFLNHTYLGILPFFKVFMPDFDVLSDAGRAQAREFIIEFITHGLIADPPEEKT